MIHNSLNTEASWYKKYIGDSDEEGRKSHPSLLATDTLILTPVSVKIIDREQEGASHSPSFVPEATGAQKDSSGKLRVDLVAPEMIEALAEGLQAGVAKGYPERNWEKGLPLDKISLAAAMRHMLKWRKGIDIDEETGVNHLKLAFLNLGMAVTQLSRARTDLDDRSTKK